MVESGVIELEKGVSEIVCAALSIWQIMLFLYIKELHPLHSCLFSHLIVGKIYLNQSVNQ